MAGFFEMDSDFNAADRLMHRAIQEKVFPGAVLLLQKKGQVLFHRAYGVVNLYTNRPVTLDTVFDLASLTKPLATSLSVLLLVQSGRLGLEQPLASVIPAFENTPKEKITPAHLLAHTSGYPAHRPYYTQLSKLPSGQRREALNAFLVEEPLDHKPGEAVEYSDLGFMVLRWMVERVSGQRLDCFAREHIFHPLGIESLFFIDLNGQTPAREFAATERCPWRDLLLEGRVSDENAFAAGGIDGHAGLFGTAGAVAQILETLLATYKGRSGGLFERHWLRRFFAKDPKSHRALGFDMPAQDGSSSGTLFSESSIGHLGYTGTSFWCDLKEDISVVLLTNRVHPSRKNMKIKGFRPLIHDALMASLTSAQHGR